MLKPMNTDDAIQERSSDIDALASWVQHSAWAPGGTQGAFTSTVDGVVERVDAENLWLRGHAADDDAHDVGVYHHLPASVDLRPLIGMSVRVTTVCEPGVAERLDRTLLVSGDAGRVWLISRSGTVHGVTHALGTSCDNAPLHAALSQRPLGPLVIGTAELQCLVPVGQSALLHMPDGSRFRVLLVKRRPDGTAAYVIADAGLFTEHTS